MHPGAGSDAPGGGTEPEADRLRAAGDRIEALLEASAGGGPPARERAEELVRLVVDLYGTGLRRLLDLLVEHDRLDDRLRQAMAADDLLASLLMVHGLHPHDVEARVLGALQEVRPYLGSHGGDVELLAVTDDGTVRLRMLGSCDGCPSSSVTLTLAVEAAVRAAAPEVTAVEVEPASRTPASRTPAGPVIPVASLRQRLDGDAAHLDGASASRGSGPGRWHRVPELDDLAPGQVGGFEVDGVAVLGCRVGQTLLVYRDHCPRCDTGMAGAVLVDGAVPAVRCPRCTARYDALHAGACLDAPDLHLQPVPLLVEHGVPRVALPEPVGA